MLRRDVLVIGLRVMPDSSIEVETTDWNSYWKPLSQLHSEEIEKALTLLHEAWARYIRSGFQEGRREFCRRYFLLLDLVIREYKYMPNADVRSALRATLSFECIAIRSSFSAEETLGAAICNQRNPCYLLAKLKMPDAPEDPQFLPLVTAGEAGKRLFYSYRQYRLAPGSAISLISYLAVPLEDRANSFKAWSSLASLIGESGDPRSRERATRLFRNVVRPILESQTTDTHNHVTELVDIGAGSGQFSAALCQQILRYGKQRGAGESRVAVWSVDLEVRETAKFFLGEMRGRVDVLSYLGADYRGWLSLPTPLPPARGLRIAVHCKTLDGLSRFSIRELSGEESRLVCERGGLANFAAVPFTPSFDQETDIRGIGISNIRVDLPDGRTFAQPALSAFYEGLWLISSSTTDARNLSVSRGLFAPIRTFNSDSLLTRDGVSVIGRLVQYCDWLFIEDPDLTASSLVEHLQNFSLQRVEAYNVTRILGLTSNYAYLLWKRSRSKPPIGGEVLW